MRKRKQPAALERYWKDRKRKAGSNPRARASSSRRKNPPAGSTMIYPEIIAVLARKDPNEPHHCDAKCKRAGHLFEHEFKPGTAVYGTPNGQQIILERRRK